MKIIIIATLALLITAIGAGVILLAVYYPFLFLISAMYMFIFWCLLYYHYGKYIDDDETFIDIIYNKIKDWRNK